MYPKAEATSQFGSEEMELRLNELHGLISDSGSTSFTALLELPPPQAVELLVTDDFPAPPVFPCNFSLIDRESKLSVFGLADNPRQSNTVLSVSSPMELDVVKQEPLDTNIHQNASSPAMSSKRKERDTKVKDSNKKSREEIDDEPSGDGGEKLPYVHVRARRGQATNNHSLAERARRDKINARMKLLQELVPGCNKISGTAMVLDEIINHVQSLQHQVEFLSTRLAAVNPRINFNLDALLASGGSSFDNVYTSMVSPSILPEDQINENRQSQHEWHSNELHRPFWGPEEDNSNFVTPQNTLLSYNSSPNSGPVSQLKMEQ